MITKHTRKIGILKIILFLCVSIFLGGCKGQEKQKQVPQTFDEFTEEVFKELVATDTLSLHFSLAHPENYGISLEEVTFGDFDTEIKEEEWLIYEQWEDRLKSYDKEELTRQQQITYDVFQTYIDSCVESKELYYYYEPLIPGMGIHVNLPYLFAEYSFYNKQDIEDYLALFPLLEGYFDQVVQWEAKKAEEGLFMSDGVLEQIITECKTYIFTEEIDETNFIYETFLTRLDQVKDLTEEEKVEYKSRQKELLLHEFSDAYRQLKTQMEKFYGLGVNEMGLSHLPKGEEYYEYKIKCSIGMTYKSVNALFNGVKKNLNQNCRDIYKFFSEDEQIGDRLDGIAFDARRPEEILVDLKERIGGKFPPLPEHGYRIKQVAPSMEEFMNPAFYLTPPVDKYQDNVIYINRGATEGTNLFPTLAHEGYPGHLYQNVYFLSKENNDLRHAFSFLGYSEGWATYVQMYVREWDGAIEEDLASLTYLEEIANLGLSAYLDIGVNYYGWTLKETAENLEEVIGGIEGETLKEIYQGIAGNPGVYLNYYVGYMEIMKLKTEAKQTQGENYRDLDFHTFLLDMGPAPFHVIEPYFQEWVNK